VAKSAFFTLIKTVDYASYQFFLSCILFLYPHLNTQGKKYQDHCADQQGHVTESIAVSLSARDDKVEATT